MAKKYVPAGVILTCDKGTLPMPLNVLPHGRATINGMNLATSLDCAPGINVPPLGVCTMTKLPCVLIPVPGVGWSPVKEDVQLGMGHPLLEDSKLRCMATGCISIHFSMAAAQAACAPPPAPEKSLADQADDYLKTLGSPLGDYGRFQLGVAEGLWAGGKGLAEGLWGMAKGGWNAVTHPVDTIQAVQEGAANAYKWAGDSQNWSDAASSAGQGISNAATWASNGDNWSAVGDKLENMSPRDWGNVTGQIAFEVGVGVATAGAGAALNAAAKTSRVARMAVRVARVADVEGHALSLAGRAARSAAGRLKVLGKVVTGAKKARRTERAALRAGSRARRLEAVTDCVGPKKCTRRGHPVDVATGLVFAEGLDFELPGPIPLIWSRVWYSRSTHQGQLGHGWHHAYNLALVVEEDGSLALRLADGRLALFAPPALGQGSYNRTERLEAFGDTTQGFRVWNIVERCWYVFASQLGPDKVYALRAVEDSNGFAIRFHYDARGHLQQLTDSAERQLPVETDAHGRIVAIHAPHPDPAATAGTVVLVRYAYDEAGDLTSVTDAEDHTTRFAYTSHLLTQETNRAGLSFYFEYEGSGPSARCRRTWGDGGIYDTKLRYDSATLTTVWDSLGHATAYTHQGGLVTTSVDAVEAVWQWTYNKYQELILERDALGQATSYDYDERGNQTQVTYPTGARVATQYNHQDLPELQTDANGDEGHRTYDEAGNLLTRTDAQGEAVEYVYSDGLLSGIDHRGIQLQYDGYFNLAHVVTADGRIRSLGYDVLGRLIKLTNAEDHVERRRYDLLGQLTWVRDADGSESTIAYDGEGNIIRAQDAQQEVEMAYVGLGQLARRRQAGTETVFHYDKEGRLTGLDNGLNQRYRFVLDPAGRIVEERGFENEVRRYAYDVAGRMITRQLPSGRSTQYRYNGTDQVTEVRYDDGTQEQYTYAPNGVLQEVRNEHALLQFTYNVQGQILTENQNEHSVMSTYDEAGQRVALHSSLGAEVYYGRDGYGRLAQVQAGAWSGLIKRDANGLELYRQLSGGLRTQWQRDAKGRPTRHQIVVQRQTSRQRRYHWQGADVLTEIEDSLSGRTRFTHDLFGALAATEYADGTQELRQPDAVGNLFRTTARTDCRYSPGGQLLEAKGTRYRYDADGNLIRKHTAAGQTWHYAWNAAGQLASVTLPSGYAVTFTYDALGRRLSKRYRGRVTHWVWDGDQPLHEWQELEVGPGRGAVQELTTWLFEDTTFAPMAKLQAGGAQSVVCDHLGTPLALYDAQGAVSWEAELDSYGAVRRGRGKPQDCPFRYQGQYEDTETGLYYNRFRYYDPETGQYISQDPIGLAGGGALHAYVADPLTQLDVFGLSEGSGILGKKLIKAGRTHGINPFVKNDFRAHHVIPHKVWVSNQKFFDDIGLGKKPGRNGMNPKDSAANGVFMPKDQPTGRAHQFDTYHSGNHRNTSTDMETSVVNVQDRFDSGAITKTQARKEISALQKAERNRLSSRRGGPCPVMP